MSKIEKIEANVARIQRQYDRKVQVLRKAENDPQASAWGRKALEMELRNIDEELREAQIRLIAAKR